MKKEIKVIIGVIFLIISKSIFAQQDARFTQFMFNQAVINPAFTGSESNLHTTLFYRNQWTNFQSSSDIDGVTDFKALNQSPTTMSFSTHSAFGGSSISGGHPAGAGLSVVQDVLGIEERTTITGSFAYHIEMSSEGIRKMGNRHLFFGLNFGITQFGLNTGGFNQKEAGDEVLTNASQKSITPEIGAGFLFKTDGYYFGVSVPHLMESKIQYSSANDLASKQARHYYGMAGYTIKTNKSDNRMNIIPSVLVKYIPNVPLQYDANLRVAASNNEAMWVGVTYRSDDAVGVMAGVNIAQLGNPQKENRKMLLGYSFDYTMSDIPSYNSGTHEIMLVFDMNLGREIKSKYNGGRRGHDRQSR